ncbi:MAG: V-type ATPase subunit [Nitrososphaerota archaeon]|jgi:V/A-type H+-transporting ATPase subunit C|nr:V-type ATPase subunit [Nitrososphaerota archaeon]MDG6941572.1 V-type ATPase subunit [Nitrososphaerota archaeon]MDG6951113.1 V-type ATPase subunit [Nitrososphaerota archaeon]
MQSSYGASFGTVKVLSLGFLTKAQLDDLAKSKDVNEIAQRLEQTWYGSDIEAAQAAYKAPESIEIAVNKHLVYVNRMALQAAPIFGKNALMAYLSKWDIENIELIIAAKSLGRTLEQTEAFLVSSRNVPVGISTSAIPLSELHALLQQPDVEAVINSLLKYGYGAVLLQRLGEYRKSGDLGVFTVALQNLYYSRLFQELRFLQGDEGVLREYMRTEVTKRNILTFLRAKEAEVSRDVFSRHIVEGGLISAAGLLDAYSSPEPTEVAKRLEPWMDITEPLERYRQDRDLTAFEVAMDHLIVRKYVPKFKSLAISLTSVFAFVIQAEFERSNVRRITYAKQYGMTEEYIKSTILSG